MEPDTAPPTEPKYRIETPEGGFILIETATNKWLCHTMSERYFKTRCDALGVPFTPTPKVPKVLALEPKPPVSGYRREYYEAHKEAYLARNREARKRPGVCEHQAELCRIRYHANIERERARCREYRHRKAAEKKSAESVPTA